MERYGDEEALNNWFEETGEAAEEMDARQNAEKTEFLEQVGREVERALDGVLSQMVEDLKEKSNEANDMLSEKLDELFEAEAEAVDKIDELDDMWSEDELSFLLAKKKKVAEMKNGWNASHVAAGWGIAAVAIASVFVIGSHCSKKMVTTDDDDNFERTPL